MCHAAFSYTYICYAPTFYQALCQEYKKKQITAHGLE